MARGNLKQKSIQLCLHLTLFFRRDLANKGNNCALYNVLQKDKFITIYRFCQFQEKSHASFVENALKMFFFLFWKICEVAKAAIFANATTA